MHTEVVRALRCPLCAAPLAEAESGSGKALLCPGGHNFDIARQGYVNLAGPGLSHSGDTSAMIAARASFLAAGRYGFIASALAETARARSAGAQLTIDAGAGTGYYLATVLDALPTSAGLALDVSKAALRRACRAHPRAAGLLCDIWSRLPIADASVGLLLCVFAPRNAAEFRRILRPGGSLVVVSPASRHLEELVDALGLLSVDPNKEEMVAASLAGDFDAVASEALTHTLSLTHAVVRTLVEMGPSSWHVDAASLASSIPRLPEPVSVTASVQLSVWHPKQSP